MRPLFAIGMDCAHPALRLGQVLRKHMNSVKVLTIVALESR